MACSWPAAAKTYCVSIAGTAMDERTTEKGTEAAAVDMIYETYVRHGETMRSIKKYLTLNKYSVSLSTQVP